MAANYSIGYYSTSREEQRRIGLRYQPGMTGGPLPATPMMGMRTASIAPPIETPEDGFQVPGNAIQRWENPPEDRSKRNAYGLTPGQQYQVDTTRIDARAYQSPRDTTPSGSGQATASVGGFTPNGNWSQMFEAGMPPLPEKTEPASGYSWERRTKPGQYDAAGAPFAERVKHKPTIGQGYNRGNRYGGWTAF